MARRMNTSVEFVNIRVEKSHESDFLAWYEEMLPDIGDHLLILVSSNYKVSLNLDLTNDCYIVAVTGTSENRDNRGLCMTSRSNVLFEAIGLALYKHEVLCGGSSWGEPEERQTNWG